MPPLPVVRRLQTSLEVEAELPGCTSSNSIDIDIDGLVINIGVEEGKTSYRFSHAMKNHHHFTYFYFPSSQCHRSTPLPRG